MPKEKNVIQMPGKRATKKDAKTQIDLIKKINDYGFEVLRDGDRWKAWEPKGDRVFKGQLDTIYMEVSKLALANELGTDAAEEIAPDDEQPAEMMEVTENPVTGDKFLFSQSVVKEVFEAGKKHALLVKERMRLNREEQEAKNDLLEVCRKRKYREFFDETDKGVYEYHAAGLDITYTNLSEPKEDVKTRYDEAADPNASKGKSNAAAAA
jgi:hypothetical protein